MPLTAARSHLHLRPAACFNVQDLHDRWLHITVRPRRLHSRCCSSTDTDAGLLPSQSACPYEGDQQQQQQQQQQSHIKQDANDVDDDVDIVDGEPVDCNVWLFRYLLNEVLSRSPARQRFIGWSRCHSATPQIRLRLLPPAKEPIDYEWNYLNEITAYTEMELDHLTSWLSTLGGGYSALGDSMDKCASIAGRISIYQFRLALQFGDPALVARSKLYMAIALIQKHRLRCAKHLTRHVYRAALADRDRDERLLNMCHGIWLKLQWSYTQRAALAAGRSSNAAAARRGAA